MYLKCLYILIFHLALGLSHHGKFASCDKINKVSCGIIPKTNIIASFIIGGTRTKYLQYPWMAAILIYTGNKWWTYCGGSLISARFILTAAHCFYGPDTKRITDIKKFKVILGMNKINEQERYRQDQCIKKGIVHEYYNYDEDTNDIAIMELCKPINFKNTKIRPICLPGRYDNKYLYEDVAIVSGWGVSNAENKATTNELLTVSLPMGKYKTCSKLLDQGNKDPYLKNTTLCTHNRGTGKDSCGGDSGGPLMAIHKKTGVAYLRGLVSFGSTMCKGYGVYTKVSYFMDWIHENMK